MVSALWVDASVNSFAVSRSCPLMCWKTPKSPRTDGRPSGGRCLRQRPLGQRMPCPTSIVLEDPSACWRPLCGGVGGGFRSLGRVRARLSRWVCAGFHGSGELCAARGMGTCWSARGSEGRGAAWMRHGTREAIPAAGTDAMIFSGGASVFFGLPQSPGKPWRSGWGTNYQRITKNW